jgi:hypothetical protein
MTPHRWITSTWRTARSAIATAEAVLRWVEQLDQPMGHQP